MSIFATYSGGDKHLVNATLKLDRIWGGKNENWNAWVQVFAQHSNVVETTFSIWAPYVDGQNPYEALYVVLGNVSFLSDVVHDASTDPVSSETESTDDIINTSTELESATPKKKKASKKAV